MSRSRITGEEPTVDVSDLASSMSVPSADLSREMRHTFAGRYAVLGLVGSGGMGTVYRARDIELDEEVALKMLSPHLLDRPGTLERFRQEVKLARRVTHRNVARTFDIGECDGERFLTMEFIDGESLSSRLSREGPLRLGFVLEIMESLCSGLEAAHAAGVVHRDLKPDNVLIARDGRVVVTDFGIARAVSDANRAATVGVALGTPAYMAPEQVEGVSDLDARADIYALGAILYECVTGEPAWSGDSPWSVAAARLVKPPPDPRAKSLDVTPAVAEIVLRCMARRREDRFADVKEVARALADVHLPSVLPERVSSPPAAAHLALGSGAKVVAVLPIRNPKGDVDDYYVEGLTDDLIDALSMTRGVRVLAKGSLGRFKGEERDAREIGRALRVDVVVDASLRRRQNLLLITARVVSVRDGFQLWAKRFERPEEDTLAVSDEVADAIAKALVLERDAPARPVLADAKALDLYLRARYAIRQGKHEATLSAVELLQQALALAPNDPTLLGAYATAELRRFVFELDAEKAEAAEDRGRQAAARALALAPNNAEAHAALCNLYWVTANANGCARALRDAIRVAPSSADIQERYGCFLLEVGEPSRALAILSSAAQASGDGTDGSPAGDILRGRALLGDWSEFYELLEAPVGDRRFHHRYFTMARLCLWRRETSAVEKVRAIVESESGGVSPRLVDTVLLTANLDVGSTRQIVDCYQAVANQGGRSRRRSALFQKLIAERYAFAGNLEGVATALRAAYELDLVDVTWLDRCPLFDGIRGEPRFAALRDAVAARASEALDILDGKD